MIGTLKVTPLRLHRIRYAYASHHTFPAKKALARLKGADSISKRFRHAQSTAFERMVKSAFADIHELRQGFGPPNPVE
jgi:hypothetical protein